MRLEAENLSQYQPPSQMYVRMKADGSEQAKGFIANYTRVRSDRMKKIHSNALRIHLLDNISKIFPVVESFEPLPGLRRQDRDRGYRCPYVSQLSPLLGGGRRVRLGHSGRQTM